MNRLHSVVAPFPLLFLCVVLIEPAQNQLTVHATRQRAPPPLRASGPFPGSLTLATQRICLFDLSYCSELGIFGRPELHSLIFVITNVLFLRRVEIEMGAGEVNLDLRSVPKQSYDVRARGGAGEATAHLPQNVGIYAQAEARWDLGHGLRCSWRHQGYRENDHWISEGYGFSKVQLRLDVRGGVGQINLLAD